MNSIYVGAGDTDLLAVVNYCRPLALNVVRDGDVFANERPVMVTAQGAQLRGVKTIATYIAGLKLPALLGTTDAEKALVDQWLTFCTTAVRPALESKVLKSIREFARALNDALLTRTFVAADHLTVADLLIWANLHGYMLGLNKKQRFEICNISRWYDFVQHQPNVQVGDPPLSMIAFELDGDPNVKLADGAAAPLTASATATKAPAAAVVVAGPAADGGAAPPKDAKDGKEKKAAKEPAKKAPKADAAAADDGDDSTPPIARLDLRVGRIVEVKRHENADSLYVEQIDVGEAQPRTVVSGLVKFIPIEKMQDQMVIVLANLKPAAMRGVTSQAMVMCASSTDGTTVEFLRPPPGSQPGDRVYFDGYEPKPDSVLNPKKKIFETVQPEFFTTEARVATWKGVPFRTAKGEITVDTVVKGSIK